MLSEIEKISLRFEVCRITFCKSGIATHNVNIYLKMNLQGKIELRWLSPLSNHEFSRKGSDVRISAIDCKWTLT